MEYKLLIKENELLIEYHEKIITELEEIKLRLKKYTVLAYKNVYDENIKYDIKESKQPSEIL
jgi:hypothetical protein